MKIINNIIAAFSLYSTLPMPKVEWSESNTKHALAFLPWIGALISVSEVLVWYILEKLQITMIAEVCILTLIPLIITGGFHLDGYMDMQDALKSYKGKEEKLEILKDPHIGAFSVIRLGIFSLAWIASLSILCSNGNIRLIITGFQVFIISRALAVMLSLKLKHAKNTGMLHMETSNSTKLDFVYCAVQAVVALCICVYLSPICSFVLIIVAAAVVSVYKHVCYVNFGGVTGDTTGYSIVVIELWLLIATAVLSVGLK